MLEVRDLHAYYGKSHILQGVDLAVREREIVSILGRNGVGRSTALKAIMGDVPARGAIIFKKRLIAGLKSYEIARLGIGYVPENRDIFGALTVEQKLTIALRISHRLYVMGHGRIVFEGSPDDLRADRSVRQTWLEV